MYSLRLICLVMPAMSSLTSTLCADTKYAWKKQTILPSSYTNTMVPNVLRCAKLCERQAKCVAVSLDNKQGICHMHAANELGEDTDTTGTFMFTRVREETAKQLQYCRESEIAVPSAGSETKGCVEVHSNAGNREDGKITSEAPVPTSLPGCINGGQWDSNTSSCINCEYGFTGRLCGRRLMDCAEGKELGYSGLASLLIQPINATSAFMARCNFDYGTTFLELRGRSYQCGAPGNFNRTWNDYKRGFGNFSCDFFIGLENLHLLTSQRRTRLRLQLYGRKQMHVTYSDFVVDSEANNYTIHYTNFSANSNKYTGGDGFGLGAPNASINHQQFCTPDRDCSSCAQSSSSGWWFNVNCSEINLHIPFATDLTLEWPLSQTNLTKLKIHSSKFILLKL